MSSSISFISKTLCFKSDFQSPGRRRRSSTIIEIASTSSSSIAPLTKNPQSTKTLQLIQNNQYKDSLIHVNGFDKSALTQLGSISDLNFINVSLENEIKEFMERLERVVEEFRILEMEKLMKKGGEMVFSIEEAEIMSREIVCKFLEKPMKYLSCGNVKLEDKLKDSCEIVGGEFLCGETKRCFKGEEECMFETFFLSNDHHGFHLFEMNDVPY